MSERTGALARSHTHTHERARKYGEPAEGANRRPPHAHGKGPHEAALAQGDDGAQPFNYR